MKLFAYNLFCFLSFIFFSNLRAQEIIKVNLSDSINTGYTETKPMISPNGELLYFARQSFPENYNGRYDEQDIYVSSYSYKGWSKAANIGEPLNNEMPNGVISIAQNGQSLFLLNAYNQNKKQEGIAVAHLSDSGWSIPKPIEIRDFHNHSAYVDYFLSANGQEMLIAVERDDSFGDQDLYVSKKQPDGSWSSPINLGDLVNTSKAEFSPFLATDNKTLFFSSLGHDGFGDADIFYTKRLDSTWTNWSKPQNLGPDVNTDGFEAYYTIPNNGTIGYYVSSEGGKEGSRDIFSITLPYKFRPDPVILMKGELLHADNTMDSSEFTVNFLTDMSSESEIFIDYDGAFFDALLPTGGAYFFYATKSGFISESHYIDLTEQKEYTEEIANIHTVPIKAGNSFNSHNLHFEAKTAELASSSYFELIRLLEIFQRNEGLQVEIKGHAFDYNESSKNDSIAFQRVKFIKDFYTDQGLDERKFILCSSGDKMKVTDGFKRHLNSKFNINNRIEFTILSVDTLFGNNVLAEKSNFIESEDTLIHKNSHAHSINSKNKEYTIYFGFDSFEITAGQTILDSILFELKLNKFDSLELIGYTCSIGEENYNKHLAELRVKSVKSWIESHLSEGSINLQMTAFGEIENPAVDKVEKSKKKDRKVTLLFKGKGQRSSQFTVLE